MDPDRGPKELQNKVQFDLRFYFARCGAENIYDMKIGDLKLVKDRATNRSFVIKVRDEETKNHKECDSDIDSPFMPEIPESKYCPVQSYLTYLYALDKSVDFLWQQPRMKRFPADGKGIWYGPE